MRSSQPNYSPVPGKDGSQSITFVAVDNSTVHPWGDSQTALTQGDTSFSIAFRAKLGTTARGILFALGTHNGEEENTQNGEGGLSFRRGDVADSIVVATGRNYTGSTADNDQRPAWTFTSPTTGSGSYDNGWHTYVFTCAPTGTNQVVMTLYVDGQQYDQRTMSTPAHLIKPEFQFGDRHGSPFDTDDGVEVEAPSNGAIDAFATWNITLSAEQAKAVADTWNRVPADFADPIQPPTSGETAILTLGTLTDTTFRFEHWSSGRMGEETSALLAGTETDWINLYGITDGLESVGNAREEINRSTWVKVTGGKYNRIVGGRTNGHAGEVSEGSGTGANSVTGNFNVQLSGADTTARNVIGGFYGTGDGRNNTAVDTEDRAGTPCTLTGDTKVVVTDGATVTGGIIGGSAVRYLAEGTTFVHDGSTSVTVRSVLPEFKTDSDHSVTFIGIKPMGIVGGDLNVDTGTLTNRGSEIKGSTSVTVDIPAATTGTFAMPIYGASVRVTEGGNVQTNFSQTVDETSTVTINAPNVTFTGKIVAGGSGQSVSVKGAATLNLIGGAFTGALLPTDQGASVVGAKELIIGTSADNEPVVDLSGAQTIGNTKTADAIPFDSITVQTDLKLGTHRFADTVIKSDPDTKVHNLTVTVTQEELNAMAGTHEETGGAYYPGTIVLGPFEGWGAGDFTFTVENKDSLTMPVQYENATWALAVRTTGETKNLCLILENRDPNLTWEEATAGATDDWMDGLPNFISGDSVTFEANRSGAETVNIGEKAYTLGKITFTGGDYTFAGTGSLTANTTTANGATLTVETTVDAGNTTLTNTDLTVSGDADFSADALTLDGTSTLTLGKRWDYRYVRFNFTETAGANIVLGELDLLLNGQEVAWGNATASGSGNVGSLKDDGTYSMWNSANSHSATVTFDAGEGNTFAFDGYRFCSSYYRDRTPRAWTVEGSNDSTNWETLDTRNYTATEVKAWFDGHELSGGSGSNNISPTWTPAQTFAVEAVTARYVRWVPTRRGGGGSKYVGLTEFQLLLNGAPVEWGTPTITAVNTDTADRFIGNTANLIDGSFENCWGAQTSSAGIASGAVAVTFDAGEGKAFTFNSYRFGVPSFDVNSFPAEWTLQISEDGSDGNWVTVDHQKYLADEAWAKWPFSKFDYDTGLLTGQVGEWVQAVFPASMSKLRLTTEGGAVSVQGTLAGAGNIDGTLTLHGGSVVDASVVEKYGFINATTVITEEANADTPVTIIAPANFVGEEIKVLGWDAPNVGSWQTVPETLTVDHFAIGNATTGTLPCYDLEARASGLYLVNKTVIYDSSTTQLNNNNEMPTALYNELRMLATQEGKREVHVVAYTRGNQALAKRWASVYAPQVFQGEGLLEFAQDGDRDILKIAYEFGISRMWFSTDTNGATQVNVIATLSSPDGATGDLTFVPGSIVRLRAESTQTDDYGNAAYLSTLAERTIGADESLHEVTFTIPYANLESVMANANFKGLRVEIVTSAE